QRRIQKQTTWLHCEGWGSSLCMITVWRGKTSIRLSIPVYEEASCPQETDRTPSPISHQSPLGCCTHQPQVQRNLRASRSDSKRVSTSPSRTGPFTLRMMERLVSPGRPHPRSLTCVHCPCEPVLPSTLVTCLMGCTRLVSMMAARRRSGGRRGVTCSEKSLYTT
uniref:Uncharacterized protein n=1 Tax=Lynx canadensis TaxID=61383 RepID=A0A667I7T6_LYNCA